MEENDINDLIALYFAALEQCCQYVHFSQKATVLIEIDILPNIKRIGPLNPNNLTGEIVRDYVNLLKHPDELLSHPPVRGFKLRTRIQSTYPQFVTYFGKI